MGQLERGLTSAEREEALAAAGGMPDQPDWKQEAEFLIHYIEQMQRINPRAALTRPGGIATRRRRTSSPPER